MVELLKCEVCGGQVSSEAKACPGCGHPVDIPMPEELVQPATGPAVAQSNNLATAKATGASLPPQGVSSTFSGLKAVTIKKLVIVVSFVVTVVVVIVVLGAFSRDTSSLDKVILGHWQNASDDEHIYFAKDGTYTLKEGDGKVRPSEYVVREMVPDKKMMVIDVVVPGDNPYEGVIGRGHTKTLRFTEDYSRFVTVDTMELLGEYQNSGKIAYDYVDSKEKP
ncbi:MAG: zinc ribbon domain-containing protein [Proteobacteria bacterium]|nr:zinc ribbon domain-containing protein [Pseudomonadota bacterium]